ncbi:hypothetical protein M413DRAFT_70252, partial [Hebeloma cylindrosporum]
MFTTNFSSLPLAICPQPDTQPNLIVTGPEAVKTATVQYFQNLYRRTTRPPQTKPWMRCPSVSQVAARVDADPFPWPQLLDRAQLRKLLSKGNSRPTPGPDGWEKCEARTRSYLTIGASHATTSSSTFPLPGSISYSLLISLVATQPGVQGRDLISYQSQLECWAKRENIPIYILQRDQKKGFDMLEPQGFYDALTAYHLPSSIADLDRSAQANVPYRIKTAYGFTDPFPVTGVTKQGGSLSPLKCTLTTSMSNRWLDDAVTTFSTPLLISTHQHRLHLPHIPADELQLRPSMVEAMDDTLLPSTSLPNLYYLARLADRFQATYGWETEWRKSALYIYNDPIYTCPNGPKTVNMPSVPYSNPQSEETINNNVPVITDFTTFLRVPINRPDLQHSHIRDLILNFHFPILSRHLPLTALRRIISQQIISKIRPYLALQPISPSDALSLDHLLATKVHEHLGFPFRFNTHLLTSPLHQRGFAFPSISRLNASLAVSGLQRDLNHHITPFRKMAAITLADWTCLLNDC